MITIPRNSAFPAVRLAFSGSPCPRLFERSAFAPTPVPMPTAIISIWIGNASVSAFNACSPPEAMFETNALSTML